jgi:integrase
MLRQDLADARTAWIAAARSDQERQEREESDFLAPVDHAERLVDFHALRHTRGVWAFEHLGATAREVQDLMRLSTVTLVNRYSKSFKLAGRRLADRTPDLSNLPAIAPAKPAAAAG